MGSFAGHGNVQVHCGRDGPRNSYFGCGSGQSIRESAFESGVGLGHALWRPATNSSGALRVLSASAKGALRRMCSGPAADSYSFLSRLEVVSSALKNCDARCDE